MQCSLLCRALSQDLNLGPMDLNRALAGQYLRSVTGQAALVKLQPPSDDH